MGIFLFISFRCIAVVNNKNDSNTCEIKRLGVLNEHRRIGIGRSLLHKAECYIKQKNKNEVFLTTIDLMVEAQRFYESNNFELLNKNGMLLTYHKFLTFSFMF